MTSMPSFSEYSDVAWIEVHRHWAIFRGALVRLHVFVDGSQVGAIRPSKTLKVEVSPGQHEVHVEGPGPSHAKSNSVTVTAQSGMVVELEAHDSGTILTAGQDAREALSGGVPFILLTVVGTRRSSSDGPPLSTSTTSGGAEVEYDLHNWSPIDILNTLAQVKGQNVPYSWDDQTQVLTVAAKYEKAVNKLVLGEAGDSAR